MNNNVFAITTCIVFVSAVLPNASAGIISAEHAYSDQTNGVFNGGAGMATDGPEVFDNRWAQLFTANITGGVAHISFTASRLAGTNTDLRVSLMSFENNQPSSVLATSLIDFASFTEGFLSSPLGFTHTVDLSSSDAALFEGHMYALVFSTDSTEANYRIYGDDVGYTGGSSMFSQNGSPFGQRTGDLYFQAGVLIPAPATALSLCLLVIPRRRRV